MIDAIMGCFVFFMALLFVYAHLLEASAKVQRFFANWRERNQPGSVDVTVNQMYGNVNLEQTEGANFRKARHARIEAQSGGKHGRT